MLHVKLNLQQSHFQKTRITLTSFVKPVLGFIHQPGKHGLGVTLSRPPLCSPRGALYLSQPGWVWYQPTGFLFPNKRHWSCFPRSSPATEKGEIQLEQQDSEGAPSPVQANNNSDFHSQHLWEAFGILCVSQTWKNCCYWISRKPATFILFKLQWFPSALNGWFFIVAVCAVLRWHLMSAIDFPDAAFETGGYSCIFPLL